MIFAMFAVAALLQAQAEPPIPQELAQVADELGECLSAGVNNADSRSAPQAAARSILATCQPLLAQATALHTRWVEASDMSSTEKREALRSNQRNIDGLEAQLVQMIRASRAD